jgi:pimeloyl-ACP methyl ester carboxylesterase
MSPVRVNDLELASDEVGVGAPLVLLHGYPFDRSMWREQIDFLTANGFRVLAPNLRGFGEMSDKLQFVAEVDPGDTERQAEACRTINTMPDMAGDVAVLMDKLAIDSAVICGLSMGGYVAFDFVHLFPTRVRALVLAGTRAPADNDQEKQARFKQVDQMLAEGMSGIAEATLPKLLSPRTHTEKPAVVARVRELILHAHPQGAAAAQRGMAARRNYSGDLPRIDVPTLVIVGREDPIRPVADAEFMQERISNSRLEVIEDAAHMTNMEQPEVFNRALLDFLQTLTNSAGASPPS